MSRRNSHIAVLCVLTMSTNTRFQYHTAVVGNKSSSIFLIVSRNVFGGMAAALIRQAIFRSLSDGVVRDAFAADRRGSQLKSSQLPLQNRDGRPMLQAV